jgi:hypothetical protein
MLLLCVVRCAALLLLLLCSWSVLYTVYCVLCTYVLYTKNTL